MLESMECTLYFPVNRALTVAYTDIKNSNRILNKSECSAGNAL